MRIKKLVWDLPCFYSTDLFVTFIDLQNSIFLPLNSCPVSPSRHCLHHANIIRDMRLRNFNSMDLGNLVGILNQSFVNTYQIEISWAFLVKLPSGECHKILMVITPQSHGTATSLWSAKSARTLLIAAGSLYELFSWCLTVVIEYNFRHQNMVNLHSATMIMIWKSKIYQWVSARKM